MQITTDDNKAEIIVSENSIQISKKAWQLLEAKGLYSLMAAVNELFDDDTARIKSLGRRPDKISVKSNRPIVDVPERL